MQNTKHLQQQQNGWRKPKKQQKKQTNREREREEKKMRFTQFNDTDKLLAYQTAYFSIQFIIVQTMQHLFLLNWGTCSTLQSSIYPLYCTATDIFITYKLRFLEVFSYIYIYIYIYIQMLNCYGNYCLHFAVYNHNFTVHVLRNTSHLSYKSIYAMQQQQTVHSSACDKWCVWIHNCGAFLVFCCFLFWCLRRKVMAPNESKLA